MDDITQVLRELNSGDPDSAERLLPLIYDELRRLAAIRMAAEPIGQTLQPTALVHEAYIRLVGIGCQTTWEHRGHFFAAAALAMRRILIDTARKRVAEKRGGGRRQTFSVEDIAGSEKPADLLALDEALVKLEADNPLVAKLVVLRYFAGLKNKEAAQCLGVSTRTVENYWAYAKAFLLREIEADR